MGRQPSGRNSEIYFGFVQDRDVIICRRLTIVSQQGSHDKIFAKALEPLHFQGVASKTGIVGKESVTALEARTQGFNVASSLDKDDVHIAGVGAVFWCLPKNSKSRVRAISALRI